MNEHRFPYVSRRSLLLGALPLAAGCRTDSAGDELIYWTGWSGHEYDLQRELIDEYNARNPPRPVRLLTQFASNAVYQKVRVALAGGSTPDVLSAVWPDELAGYALRGVLTPLDEFLAGSGRSIREFTPGIRRLVTVAGKVYGLTVTTNTNLIVFNKGLFREVGMDPENPPITPDELDEAARRCTKIDSSGKLIRYGFRPLNLDLWAYAFGGGWYDAESERVTANHPANVAALKWMAGYNRLFDLRKVQAFTSTFGSNTTATGPFYTGRMAMWQTGEWASEFIRRYGKDLDWGWFALPSPPGGRPNTTGAGGSVFVIPAAARDKEQSWRFLNWITGHDPVYRFCWGIKNTPALIEAGHSAQFTKDPMFRFAVNLAQGENSFGAPPIPIWSTYKREIQRVEDLCILGGADPQRTLDSLQRNMSRELQRTLYELSA
jgi:multiple sugar transport system substrate-binding protein